MINPFKKPEPKTLAQKAGSVALTGLKGLGKGLLVTLQVVANASVEHERSEAIRPLAEKYSAKQISYFEFKRQCDLLNSVYDKRIEELNNGK